MQKFAVIMAGGGGTRFWPLSRQYMPKQLLNLSGNDVMINEAIKRLKDFVPLENIFVVTNKKQRDVISQLIISELPKENILFEPMGRNTAACIAYAAMTITARCEDAVMCVLPSDHYISNESKFRDILCKACKAAEETEKLITIGVKPTFPSTGYGYIRFNAEKDNYFSGAYEVVDFIEKPAIEKARMFYEDGNYLWNSGMFAWKVSTILENIARYLPRMYKNIMRIKEVMGTDDEQNSLEDIYSRLQSISVDFGIMERSDDVLVIPGDFDWNDLGSWDALGAIYPTDVNGNIVRAKHVCMNTRNSIIYSGERLVATIGLENLIVVDTNDALLICPKDKAQEVKNIVEILKKDGLEEYI